MRRRRGRSTAELTPNLTSLIDVTFLLIVFFVLVSRIVETENVNLNLPTPAAAPTMLPGKEQQVIINVVPAPGGLASSYRVGERTFSTEAAGLKSLTQHLAALYAANPHLSVNLRADRNTHYTYVRPVVDAVADAARLAGVAALKPRISLVVLRES
jgi:biopolymer transport protein ExbD